MENLKFTAQELLDSFVQELNGDEMNEIYKALIAYSIGVGKITDDFDEIIDYYYRTDHVRSFVNEELIEYADKILFDNF